MNGQPLEPTARIPARNQRRAMDWSLVLASQGIETAIEHDAQSGWALVVPGADLERALEAIRLYEAENRRWRWHQPVFKGAVWFDWTALVWVGLMGVFFVVSETRGGLREIGLMDNAAFAHGQWWRLFTATCLHADLPHLALNSVVGLLFLGLAMGRYGPGVGLLAAQLAGAAGNLATVWLSGSNHRGLGASGVVMGALGLIAIQSLGLLREHPAWKRYVGAGLAGGLMLFVLLGMTPGTDIVAHTGGFVGGVVLGAVLAPFPTLAQRAGLNLGAGLAFGTLLGCSWALALLRATAA
ncbi:MAG: rhomboid family intramembrane serine protease [Verrucomicrobiae bacterium]|nr:rhomboid family intramembrane serine protease [Verrucomicrobiae bacterium]